jgi:hypothetical protein
VNQTQIEEILQHIDNSFGQELPLSTRPLVEADLQLLQRLFGDAGHQSYQDDQSNRQIIRTYLTNAVILGCLAQNRIVDYSQQMETQEGRAALSLHILMSSVEDAEKLPQEVESLRLKSLLPEPGSPPHLQIVGN